MCPWILHMRYITWYRLCAVAICMLYFVHVVRAGFTLNRALFRKKCGGPRAPNTIIGLLLPPTVPSITWLPDYLHTHTQSCHFIVNRQMSWVGVCQCVYQSTVQAGLRWTLTLVPHNICILFITSMTFGQFPCVGTLQNCFWSSCGGPIFVGAPVRPNMLNMPKSASARCSLSIFWSTFIVTLYFAIRRSILNCTKIF